MAKKKPIVSKEGQWKYPGQETIIPNANGRITMQGVPYPVFGIDDLGYSQMMMPGAEYQFPGNSVYEIPMAKKGGTKKVKINSLPKAQNGEEVQTVYTAGTNEPWEPLPEMTPEEAKQWGRLRDDAVGITGNYATNAQIYATYQRAKEMGLGYDDYVSKEKAKAQQQRDAVVPKTIPGWHLSLEELKELSSLPGSPIMYNRATGEYSFPNLEMYNPSGPYIGNFSRGELALGYYPGMFEKLAEYINDRNVTYIDLIKGGSSVFTKDDWEKMYGSPYDPNKNYTVNADEMRQGYWTGPTEDLRGRGAEDHYFTGYKFSNDFSPDYLTYTHHVTPDEAIMQEAYGEAKRDMDTPLAKFLGSKGEPPKSVLERNYRIAADKIAEDAIFSLEGILGDKANSEQVRSVLDMDPKIFEDIINSPFKSGSITLDSNDDAWGKKLTITDQEAKTILRNIEFIKRSGKYNFLLDPSPADMAIQGIGNTLSWMAGNDNAEGPGTIGEAFHNFTGNTAHNKGYNVFNTLESPLVAGRNIVENIAAPILSGFDGGTGIYTLDSPGKDFFTQVPTMRGMNMTWNPNYSQLENDIANFTYTAAQDAALSGIGTVARPFVNKTLNSINPIGKNFLTDNPKAFYPNSSVTNRVRSSFEPEVGFNLSNEEVAAELAKTKSQYVSPFDIRKYNYAPGSSTRGFKAKPLFEDRDFTYYILGTNKRVLTEEGAKYFNKKYGLNYKNLDQISDSDLKLHINDVFDHNAPKPSKNPGGVKYKPNFFNEGLGVDDSGFKISNKWTKDELADARKIALDFDYSGLNAPTPVKVDATGSTVKGVLMGGAGIGATIFAHNLTEDYGKPLYNKAVPYLNAGARQLGINSNPFSLATRSGANSTEGVRNQVMMSLNDEGNTVSSARVNESAEGDVIIGGEFIENANNTVNKASWFKENPNIPISDKNFTAEEAKGFYGIEDGKFKAGKLEDFKPETVVVPIRPFENSYEPVREAGVTGENTLRLITDPKDPSNPESSIIYNNAPQSGKMIFYSPSTKNAWFIYNADPKITAGQINKLIQENSDIRYIPIDNGRYEHYIDKSEGLLSEDDFKQYYSADVDRQGNPGYNIVLKRKGKKLGGPIYRTGGELPKAQFGPPTAQDSAMVANRANEVGRYLANNGYLQVSSDPARFANRNDFRQDLEGGGRRFQNANVAGNIIDFTSGNQGRFPGNYTEGYTGYTPAWFQRDLAPGVLNPNVPLSYYDTRILPQRFDVYESVIDPVNAVNNRTSARVKDVLGKYTYEKLAVTPWKKLTIEQKIKRLKRYGASGSPYDDPRVGIRELKGILEEEKIKKIAKVEPPVVDKPVQIPSQPDDIKIPFKADITRRQYPITLTGDEALDRLNKQLYGNFGTLTEDGYIPTDDPKYYPYRGIGPGTLQMRRSYGKFEQGGELPKAQTGLRKVVYNDPKQFKIANQAYKDSMNLYNIGNQEMEDFKAFLNTYNLDQNYLNYWNPGGKTDSRYHNKIAPILYTNLRDRGAYRNFANPETSYDMFMKTDGSDFHVHPESSLREDLGRYRPTFKKPETRPVFEEVPDPEMIDIKPFAIPQIGLKPQLGNIPQLPIPQTNKQRVIINTPQGDKIRVQDPKTKKFMWWEDEKGLPTDIENPTGIPYYDFKYKNGGGLPKAQNGRNILYVDSKRDPAYRAYSDSLNLYKAMVMQDKLMGTNTTNDPYINARRVSSNKSPLSDFTVKSLKEGRTPRLVPGFEYLGPIARDFDNAEELKDFANSIGSKNDIKLVDYYKSLGFNDNNIMYHTSADVVHPKIKPVDTYWDGSAWSPVYKEPTRKVVVNKGFPIKDGYIQIPELPEAKKLVMKEATGLPLPQVDVKPQLQNIERPKSTKQHVVINTPQGDKVRVQDIKTKKFLGWEEISGEPIDFKNKPTGNTTEDFPEMKRIKTPAFAEGGDISVPNLRRVKIDALPKAQVGTEMSYTLPELEIRATRSNPVPKMLEPGFQDELAYQEAKNKLRLRQQLESAQARFMGGENFLDAFKDHNLAGQAFQAMVERYPDDKRLTSKETTRGKAAGKFLIQQAIERYLGKKLPLLSTNQDYQNIIRGSKIGWTVGNTPNEIKDFMDAERNAQNQYANYTEELQDKVDNYEKTHGIYKPSFIERMRKTRFKFETGGVLPEAQTGINWSNPFKSSFPEQPKSDWYNAMNTVMPPKENFDWRSTIENVAKPKPYTLPDEYFNELKILENSVKEGYRDGKFYPYDSPEKGNPTIGYGHKLTEKDIKSGRFKEGLLEKEAEDLMRQDVESHRQTAIDRYDTRYGKGAFNKLHPDLKQLAIDFTYNGIDFTATGEDYKNSFPTFWTAANEYSTAQDAAIKQKALETMLANYQRGFKGKVLGERNVYTQKILNNLKKTGGELPKAQNGPPRVKLQEIQDLQDKYAVPSGYVRVPDVVRQQRLAKGIPADQIPEFEKITKSVSPELQSIIDRQNARSTADKLKAAEEKRQADRKNFRPAPINDPAGLPSVPIFEAAFMAPVALASTSAALTTPLFGTGISAANVLNPVFFGQGIKNTLDSQSDMRKSWTNLYNDRTKSNLLDAALETGLNSLNFLGARSLGSDLNKLGNYAGNTVNSIRGDIDVIRNARKYAADLQWQAPDDVFNLVNTQRSRQLGPKQLRLKGSPNAPVNFETSNSIVRGMPTIEYQEMLDNGKLYDYKYLNKSDLNAILNSNPNISKKIIIGDRFNSNTPPELQSREALQKAFDEGNRFGLMWGIKDLDNYEKMSKLPLDAYRVNKEEATKLSKERSNISSKINSLLYKIADEEDRLLTEYLINQKGLPEKEARDIVERGITPPGTTRATFYHEAKPYFETKIKASAMYHEMDMLKKKKANLKFKEDKILKDQIFIQNELDLVDKYSENFLDPEFKRKIQELYKEAGANMPSSADIVRSVDPSNSKLIYYNNNEPTFLELSDHNKQYLDDNFTRIGGWAGSDGTFTIGGKSWFNSPEYRSVFLRKPKTQRVPTEELVKREPFQLVKPNTWLNPIMGDKVVRDIKYLPVEGADVTPELIFDDRVIMDSPDEIGHIAAHEAGHPLQRIYDWKHLLGGYDADYNYFKSNDLTPLSKRFQDAMVNADKSDRGQTWLAAPHELHSELMGARLRQAKKLMTEENLSMEAAIKRIKGLEKQGDTDLFRSYLSDAEPSDGGLNRHFKATTSESEKINLLKLLPVVIGTIGGAGAIGSQTQEKKKGGQLVKAQEGLPKDYEKFLKYSETAPENRRPDSEWQYGNPRQYDHYGMWDALGKPENFDQALEMNPHWQPDPYDNMYHGFSTNPNTGVWLKSHIPGESHPGDTGWMEYKDFMLSNDRNWGGKNQNLVYDPDLQRMRYVDRKKQGGVVKKVKINSLPNNWKNK